MTKRIGVIVFSPLRARGSGTDPGVRAGESRAEVAGVRNRSAVGAWQGPVASSAGVRVDSRRFGARAFDTIVMAGGTEIETPTPGVLAFLQSAYLASRRTASICTGAFFLAEAGILDDRRASTHWYYSAELQRRFPRTRVEADRIYINDGPVWTSAGMTACIDMALALVEEDFGIEVSREIARKLVVYHRRSGGQSQFSAMPDLEPKSDRIQAALAYARSHLRKGLSIATLAEVANLGARQFSRAFRAETGQSPRAQSRSFRVEAARAMLEEAHRPGRRRRKGNRLRRSRANAARVPASLRPTPANHPPQLPLTSVTS